MREGPKDEGKAWRVQVSSSHDLLQHLALYSILTFVYVFIISRDVISFDAAWCEVQPLLVPDLSTLIQDKQSGLSNSHHIVLFACPIIVIGQLVDLFSDIAEPVRVESGRLLLHCFLLLSHLLSIDIVVCECLQTLELIALKFQIGIGDNDAVCVGCIDEGSRNKKVWQLDLEQEDIILKEKQSAIHRLYTYYLLR